MPMFNTSNPFRSSSGTSSTQSSRRRAPPRKSTTQPSQAPPPPDPRLVSLAKLDDATARLEQLQDSFVLPRELSFQPANPSRPEVIPKLDYSPNNAPVHAFDEALTKLLIELDGVDSCGGEPEIRTRRKELVVRVEKELERLDGMKKEVYERQHSGSHEGRGAHEDFEQRQRNADAGERGGKAVGNSSSQSVASNSRTAGPPSLPPGIPLPPRDYTDRAFHASQREQPQQQQNNAHLPPATTSSSMRRPSDHSEFEPSRPPPAYRSAGEPSAWKSSSRRPNF